MSIRRNLARKSQRRKCLILDGREILLEPNEFLDPRPNDDAPLCSCCGEKRVLVWSFWKKP